MTPPDPVTEAAAYQESLLAALGGDDPAEAQASTLHVLPRRGPGPQPRLQSGVTLPTVLGAAQRYPLVTPAVCRCPCLPASTAERRREARGR